MWWLEYPKKKDGYLLILHVEKYGSDERCYCSLKPTGPEEFVV